MTTPQIILSIGAAFVLIGIVGWCLTRAGTLGEEDPEENQGRVVFDPPIVVLDMEAERHQWKNAGAKAFHAE